MLDRVDEHREGEEREHADPNHGAHIGNPLAPAQRHDGDANREPDEDQLEQVAAEGGVTDLLDVKTPGRCSRQRQRAADPDRVGHPVEDRAQAGRQSPPGQLHPLIGAALLCKGGAQLGHHQCVGQQEHDGEDGDPGEGRCAVARHLAQRVQPDEGTDGEEQHVETAQALDELLLLLQRHCGRVFDQFLLLRHEAPPGLKKRCRVTTAGTMTRSSMEEIC